MVTDGTQVRRLESCDGDELRAALVTATTWLEHSVEQINALNVFPVPDGDTGSNMWLTLQSAVGEANGTPGAGVGAVAHAASHGALMGARGNSGVILSQILRGFARSLVDKRTIQGHDLAAALTEGAATAYKGVIKPVEGTILTVARESAAEAELAAREGQDLMGVLERAVVGAYESLLRTPALLPVLAEAGVVDAGGQGYVALLEGMLRHFKGEAAASMSSASMSSAVPGAGGAVNRGALEEIAYGYCTEFIIKGQDLDVDALRSTMADQGESVLVVGDSTLVKVHLHTLDPGAVLSAVVKHGSLHRIKIDNMEEQHREFLRSGQLNLSEPADATPPGRVEQPLELALVAVASGEGMSQVFHSLGATIVVPGGQTMNPSTRELLQAVESAPAAAVILLPNNSNIVLTAQQVLALTRKRLVVVPTETLPQGVAALMAFNYEADLETNAAAMTQAAKSVNTIEITRAVRAVKIDGVQVEEGAPIALMNGQLVATGQDLIQVAMDALAAAEADGCELITVYYGDGTDGEETQRLGEEIERRWPGKAVEVIAGGQPYYPYIISVE